MRIEIDVERRLDAFGLRTAYGVFLLTRIKEAGAVRVVYGALHLRPGAKQWFLQWLAERHPELVSSYRGLGHAW